jgi:ubiquinol-cytochrome c reductase cytochrome b subunit
MDRLRALGRWLDRRLQLAGPIVEVARHRVPRSTASWFYVFGSVTFVLFLLQIVTGVCLAFNYVPSGAEAWNSLQALNHKVPAGWFLRAMHFWGSTFMVGVMLVHMIQVFLFGAFKFPRELTWTFGVVLLLLTLGMAFSGQILRFDQDAYWGIGIGASIAGRIPLIGAGVTRLLLGGPIIAGDTLSRFFAAHVFIVPGLLLLCAGLHVWMVVTLGINEWPMPGRVVTRERYIQEYHELTKKDGVPFVPDAFQRDLVAAGLAVLAVVTCAAWFGPFGPSGPPDPTIIETSPAPDFFFLWLYATLSFLPRELETPFVLIVPLLGILVLFLVPYVSGLGEKHWSRRPVSVLIVLVGVTTFVALTALGETTPWAPHMDAWTADQIPADYLQKRSPLERQGALVLQNKQCRNCHALGGHGGQRGPALDGVASRLTHDELIRQVVQGGGNMPSYGKNLSPPEVTALVAFLDTLRGPHAAPARDPTRRELSTTAATP